MALPTDANVDLLICDAVRQNPDGKLDVAGYYPTAEVRLDPAATLPVVVNLTFVFVFKDGDGQFRPVIRIVDPLGNELHQFEVPEVKKEPGLPCLLMLPVGQIPIARSGRYTISLEISGQRYQRTARIYQ